ncbi:hypothetical protein K3Z86_31225, partial [Pseudomonas aeruginosa]|nr:hypothetical protein [Pseudomonas aeruginosa]
MTCENATLPEILELSPRLEDADPGVRRLALSDKDADDRHMS